MGYGVGYGVGSVAVGGVFVGASVADIFVGASVAWGGVFVLCGRLRWLRGCVWWTFAIFAIATTFFCVIEIGLDNTL